MASKKVILVAGTHSWDPDHIGMAPDWFEDGSPFVKMLVSNGVDVVFSNGRPFTWSTELGGTFLSKNDTGLWHAAGLNLYSYVVPPLAPDRCIPPEELVVLTHSHGMQVALFAFAAGLRGDLVSVSGPVRGDMKKVTEKARGNIGNWLHLHTSGWDFWQVAGAMFDGHIGVVRKQPLADKNDTMEGGHTTILRDPTCFGQWIDNGWLEWLR